MRCGTLSTRMAPFLLFAFPRPSSPNIIVNADVCVHTCVRARTHELLHPAFLIFQDIFVFKYHDNFVFQHDPYTLTHLSMIQNIVKTLY